MNTPFYSTARPHFLNPLFSKAAPPQGRAVGTWCRRLGALALLLANGPVWAQTPASPAQPSVDVGMTQLDAGGLPVTLVYPTQQTARGVISGPFVLQVAPDAAPAPGQRRLVVLSHGSGGSAVTDHDLAATLARAGFVVAQPQHSGDNFKDSSRAGPSSWQTRPAEVSRVIDALAAHPSWKAALLLDKVGVHGMSAGGVTALSLAGAQWRLLNLVQHCLPATRGAASPDPGFCFFGQPDVAAQAARAATYEGARGAPEAYLPAELKALHGGRSPEPATTTTTTTDAGAGPAAAAFDARPDRRIAAVTLAVPVAAIFSADSLARIRVPLGLVSAGKDQLLPAAGHSAHVLRHCSTCTTLADLPGAGHFDLLAPWPADVAQSVGARQAQGGYPEPGFDSRQRDAAWARIAAFYLQHLAP